jgi:hypothetical protein
MEEIGVEIFVGVSVGERWEDDLDDRDKSRRGLNLIWFGEEGIEAWFML